MFLLFNNFFEIKFTFSFTDARYFKRDDNVDEINTRNMMSKKRNIIVSIFLNNKKKNDLIDIFSFSQ